MTMDYNGMIPPIGAVQLPGRGLVSGRVGYLLRPRYYKATLLAMMADWRRQFEHPDLPFLIVQLPNYGPVPAQPDGLGLGRCARGAASGGARGQACGAHGEHRHRRCHDLHPTNKAKWAGGCRWRRGI